jgi:hypothetical protein
VREIIMDQDKKKGMVREAPSSSSGPSSKRFAKTQIHEDKNPSFPKMARIMSNSEPPPPPNEFTACGSPVLRILMSFLDNKTLKTSRGVCKSWEDTARRTLMTRADLNIQSIMTNLPQSKYGRVELYSSWVLEYNNKPWTGQGGTYILKEWGEAPTSLTLKGLTLDSDCLQWIRKILSSWCPNVSSLSLQFQDTARNVEDRIIGSEELEHFQTFLQNMGGGESSILSHIFAPYPILPNIHSLRVGKKSNPMTSFLSINVILSCPNLKHLFVSEVSIFESWREAQEEVVVEDANDGCRILHFLSQRPDITRKLVTFEWQDDSGRCSTSFHNEDSVYSDMEVVVRDFAAVASHRRRNNNNPSLPILQFGDVLQSLHWNVLELDEWSRLLFPGLLETVAANIKVLDLRRVKIEGRRCCSPEDCVTDPWLVDDFGTQEDIIRRNVPGLLALTQFPAMPNLSTIHIDSFSCNEISLSELVDAAPNLKTLQLSGCESCDSQWMKELANGDFDYTGQ